MHLSGCSRHILLPIASPVRLSRLLDSSLRRLVRSIRWRFCFLAISSSISSSASGSLLSLKLLDAITAQTNNLRYNYKSTLSVYDARNARSIIVALMRKFGEVI